MGTQQKEHIPTLRLFLRSAVRIKLTQQLRAQSLSFPSISLEEFQVEGGFTVSSLPCQSPVPSGKANTLKLFSDTCCSRHGFIFPSFPSKPQLYAESKQGTGGGGLEMAQSPPSEGTTLHENGNTYLLQICFIQRSPPFPLLHNSPQTPVQLESSNLLLTSCILTGNGLRRAWPRRTLHSSVSSRGAHSVVWVPREMPSIKRSKTQKLF